MSGNSLTALFLQNGNNLTYSDYIEQITDRNCANGDKTKGQEFIEGEFTKELVKDIFQSNSASLLRKLQIIGTIAKVAPGLLNTESVQGKTARLLDEAREYGCATCRMSWVPVINRRLQINPETANILSLASSFKPF